MWIYTSVNFYERKILLKCSIESEWKCFFMVFHTSGRVTGLAFFFVAVPRDHRGLFESRV